MMVSSLNSASKHTFVSRARQAVSESKQAAECCWHADASLCKDRSVRATWDKNLNRYGDKPVHARDASVQTFLTSWDVLAKLWFANCRQDTRICDSTHKQFKTGLKTWLLWSAYP